jgi:hypothetical protein
VQPHARPDPARNPPRTRCSAAARAAPPCYGMPYAAVDKAPRKAPENPHLRRSPKRETAGQAPAPCTKCAPDRWSWWRAAPYSRPYGASMLTNLLLTIGMQIHRQSGRLLNVGRGRLMCPRNARETPANCRPSGSVPDDPVRRSSRATPHWTAVCRRARGSRSLQLESAVWRGPPVPQRVSATPTGTFLSRRHP